MVTRDTLASSADHTLVSELPSNMASQAAGLQPLATEAIRDISFFGPADLLSSDSELFGNTLQSVGLQAPSAIRPPLSEGTPSPSFSGQNFVETGPPPVQGPQSDARSRPTRSPSRRGDQEGAEVDGVPQISGVKPPAKPFYMGLVGVPGVGFMNTVFSRHPSGEFDPTREASEALLAQPLSSPDTSQPRSLTPAVVRLNVNPKDMILTYAKKVTATRVRANYVRRELNTVTGHAVEHHWDELDIISLTCTTGNFWVNGGLHYPRGESASTSPTPNTFQAGFRSASRAKSLAYRKLQAVMAMFRNNGCGWLTGGTTLRSSAEQNFFGKDYNIIVNPGSAFLMYDNVIWYGHFESMQVNESGDSPNWFEFSLEFKVARTVDLNGVSEADVLTGAETGSESFFANSAQSRTAAQDEQVAIIVAEREESRETERSRVAVRLIELRESGQLTATDEQIDKFSREAAAKSVTSASNRAGAGSVG